MRDKYKIITRYMSGMSIADYYKGKVEQISIKYNTRFVSFAGKSEKDGCLTIKKIEAADFYLPCPNEECTEGYIDLRHIVSNVVSKNITAYSGETTCCGKTASDHPNQKCDVRVEYWIEVQYTQS